MTRFAAIILLILTGHWYVAGQAEVKAPTTSINTITNLYDAFGKEDAGLTKDFGFSCIINYQDKIILFDAGTNADIFKNNVEYLGIDATDIDFVVVSHSHFDHINGLDYLLEVNPDVKIYFPFDLFWGANTSFSLSGNEPSVGDSLSTEMQYFGGNYETYTFNQTGRFWNSNIEFVKESTTIAPGITLVTTSSPYMGYFNKYPSLNVCDTCDTGKAALSELNEISLSLEGEDGETLIVGCSHSTVEKIVATTKAYTNQKISLLYGGYHLLPYDRATLNALSTRLKEELGVKSVAPAHCTGHLAFSILKRTYGDKYVFAGLGETIKF